MKLAGKVTVVTGASSGIGRALAVELGLQGASVVLAARSKDALDDTARILSGFGVDHLVVPFDVTSDTSIRALLEAVMQKYKRIDIFVNNAGVGLFQSIAQSDPEDAQAIFATNFWGPLTLIQLLAPKLRGGMLVNISSAAAKYAPVNQGLYAASKAALERITEALGLEESGIRTLLVVPDRTDSPFMQHVLGPKENAKLALQLKFAAPDMVARKIVRAIQKDARICYTTQKAWVYTVLSAVFPGIVRKILLSGLKPKRIDKKYNE